MNKLSNTASIATIIGTIIAIFTFITQIQPDETKSNKIINNTQNRHENLQTMPQPKQNIIVKEKNTTIEENIDLKLKIALSISYTSDKNEVLFELTKYASNNQYYEKALTVAEHLSYTSTKSDAYAYIARKAMKAQEIEFAQKAAKLIPYTSVRNEILKEIASNI